MVRKDFMSNLGASSPVRHSSRRRESANQEDAEWVGVRLGLLCGRPARYGAPALDLAVLECAAARGQFIAARVKCQAARLVHAALQRQQFLVRVEVPDLDEILRATDAGQSPGIGGMNRHRVYDAVMPSERKEVCPTCGVREPYGSILAARGDPFAVRGECDADDFIGMPAQCPYFGSLTGVPKPYGAIGAGAGEPFAVRTEGDDVNNAFVSMQDGNLLGCIHVP